MCLMSLLNTDVCFSLAEVVYNAKDITELLCQVKQQKREKLDTKKHA